MLRWIIEVVFHTTNLNKHGHVVLLLPYMAVLLHWKNEARRRRRRRKKRVQVHQRHQ